MHALPLPHAPGEVRFSPRKLAWNAAIVVLASTAPWFVDLHAIAVLIVVIASIAGFINPIVPDLGSTGIGIGIGIIAVIATIEIGEVAIGVGHLDEC